MIDENSKIIMVLNNTALPVISSNNVLLVSPAAIGAVSPAPIMSGGR
jgi:hypothetical protein